MKVFFDTSVLVPFFITGHIHHEKSFATVGRYLENKSCCAAHSLAEIYSTLTRMPPGHRVPRGDALQCLAFLHSKFQLVALSTNETFRAISELSALGLTGGAIYDGLLAHSALKAKAEVIYTWNMRHFQQFGTEIEKRLRTPEA